MKNRNLLLAIDDVSLPYRSNTGLYLSKPSVRFEPVLMPAPFGSGAPDDLGAHFYGTVLYDEGKYRMWYYASHWGKNPDWSPRMMQQLAKPCPWFKGDSQSFQGPLCYAESNDGIIWVKPNLNQVLFKGSRENNAFALPHTIVSAAIVIKDTDEPNPDYRYKMTYEFFPVQTDPVVEENGTTTSVALAVSPDGINWKVIGIPYRGQFVEPSSFIKHDGKYIIHYQTGLKDIGEGGYPCGRVGMARVSESYENWPDLKAEAFALPEPENPTLRGISGEYDQVHLGIGAASFGNVCVGLYGLWHGANFGPGIKKISCDLGLVVSNDGIHFREPVKGHRFIRREDSLATPVPGYNFNTVLCQANGILNVGDETRIYHGRWRNTGGHSDDETNKYSSGEVALATLPRDRWGAIGLNPDKNEGVVCSAEITFPEDGSVLYLNADDTAGITVEILNEQFRPIPGFSDGRTSCEGGLDCRVEWPEHDLAELGGKTVRIQVRLRKTNDKQPRVYAMSIVN